MTGGVGTGKTFVSKVIFQALMHHYNKQLGNDPLKTKVIRITYTGKVAYNIGDVTAQSILQLSFKAIEELPLDSNILHVLSKQYAQLHLVLIDEILLIGSHMLFNIDKRLREILYNPTKSFANLDTYFVVISIKLNPYMIPTFLTIQSYMDESLHIHFGKAMLSVFKYTTSCDKMTKLSYISWIELVKVSN